MNSPKKSDGKIRPDDDEQTYRLSQESPIAPEGIVPPPPVTYDGPSFRKAARAKANGFGSPFGFSLLIFITSVCVMTLELTASRLIAKHVGSSLYTWTSVIGVVLAGITLGNWWGGWLADRTDRHRSLAWMYILGSVSCGGILWLDQLVASLPRPDLLTWPQWIVVIVAAIFLLPALCLGATSPLIASMAIDRSAKTGSAVGNVYAWGALGSIVGTFVTGFYLIDTWGTHSIVGMTSATLAVLAIIVAGSRLAFRTGVLLGWMQLLGWMTLASVSNADVFESFAHLAARLVSVNQTPATAALTDAHFVGYWRSLGNQIHELGLKLRLRDDGIDEYRDESNYSDIRVNHSIVDGTEVKALRLDKLIHSYYHAAEPTALYYAYERIYAAVTKKAALPPSFEPINIPISDLANVQLDRTSLPSGVILSDDGKSLEVEKPTHEIFLKLLGLAPEAFYWRALEELQRETQTKSWGGFAAVNLPQLPEGAVIPDDLSGSIRHDDSLDILVTYQPMSNAVRDRLISNTASGGWYHRINELRRGNTKTTACFYGGGGYIFPRWFLKEFPGSPRIDVAELDPAVHAAVVAELGLSPEQDQRIRTVVGDARNFVDDQLRDNQKRKKRNEPGVMYDFIYADAFNDFSVPWHLTTLEFLQKTSELLSERGVFQANIIDLYPRSEYPGMFVGVGQVEYQGRLPTGLVSEKVRNDRTVRAISKYAPLEVLELGEKRFQLRIPRVPTKAESKQLKKVDWEEPMSSSGTQAEAGAASERQNWNSAIDALVRLATRKQTYYRTIPHQLKLKSHTLKEWTSLEAPFEYVEIYPTDDEKFVLGLRGKITPEMLKQVIGLVPDDQEWSLAVTTAALNSRRPGGGQFLGRYVATAAKVFPNIYVFSSSSVRPGVDRDTYVMVCSRQPIDLNSLEATGDWSGEPFASLETLPPQSEPRLGGQMSAVLALSDGQILTDDFAPVENLLVPVFAAQE